MIYHQSTGQLFAADGVTLVGTGHAGNGPGQNNPAMQFVHNIGPLPVGEYTIGVWGDHATLGPVSAPLIPVAQGSPTDSSGFGWLQGRGGFYIHGPEFSEGCIVMPYSVRLALSEDADRSLEVVA